MRRAVATLVAFLALAAPAAAAECPRTSLGDIEDEVMCPVCGTTLALAEEAPQAQRERALIERLIADCKSKDEVKAALTAEFGESVLALPDDEGFELAAYLVPALAILLAAAGIAAAMVRWRRGRGRTPEAAPEPSARLNGDLERYDL